MDERPRTWLQSERRALVADLVRTQTTLQARTEQLEEIFASRWYRLARLSWRLRRGSLFRRGASPRPAAEDSFARSLESGVAIDEPAGSASGDGAENGAAPAAAQQSPLLTPIPGLDPPRRASSRAPGTRLLLAGHSLSFAAPLARRLRESGAAVREDVWRSHGVHDEEAGAAALAWADTVLCEWCLGNAVWHSRNKLPGQRLVVRFHRMELETPYPGEVELDRVDAMVFVARHVLEQACERWGWEVDDPRFRVLPNGVDAASLRLPKLPGAEHTLAMVGYVPRLKRLDRALDLLAALRRDDPRYRLAVKGREPWEHGWIAGRGEDRAYYERLRERLEEDAELRGAVSFEPFGDDVAGFLRRAGWILSTSEVEGHSVALAEGMASGAVPVVLERPGAREQYGERWVHAEAEAAAAAILAAQRTLTGSEHGQSAAGDTQPTLTPPEVGQCRIGDEAAAFAAERWDWGRLEPAWDELLLAPHAAPRTAT
jgi:glycosyltransferase involved in cell wall biosynthesis